jgi:L-asparaginase II
VPSSTGGSTLHYCGSAARSFCQQAFRSQDPISLRARPQCVLAGLGPAASSGASPGQSGLQVEDDRDGAVVDQGDFHVGTEDAGLHPGTEGLQGLYHRVDQGLGNRAWGGGRPGRAAALGEVGVERELADHEQRRGHVGAGFLPVENPQAPELGSQLRGLLRGVMVRDADQDEKPGFIDGADDLPVHGHAGVAYPLYDGSHSTAGYLPLRVAWHEGIRHTACMTNILGDAVANPVLAEVVRSGFVESRHRGAVAGLAADGTVAISVGSAGMPFFPRSANKPLQATAMLRCGLGLESELLALAAASHSGEDFHVDGVRKILSGAGLREDDLRCPPSWPLDIETARRLVARGQGMSRIRMNCSGKHAAMLATCVTNGWPTDGYLAQDHPLQRVIRLVVEELAGEESPVTGVDGCGAPLFALTLTGLARAFRALVLAPDGTPERRVADAMRAYPEWTSGTSRDERRLMDAVPGLLIKGGAEGCDAFALADGRAGAIKIDDGAARARTPVTVAALRALGAAVPDELATVPVIGGESTVGAIRAAGAISGADWNVAGAP